MRWIWNNHNLPWHDLPLLWNKHEIEVTKFIFFRERKEELKRTTSKPQWEAWKKTQNERWVVSLMMMIKWLIMVKLRILYTKSDDEKRKINFCTSIELSSWSIASCHLEARFWSSQLCEKYIRKFSKREKSMIKFCARLLSDKNFLENYKLLGKFNKRESSSIWTCNLFWNFGLK